MSRCPKCGWESPTEVRYCENCGEKLASSYAGAGNHKKSKGLIRGILRGLRDEIPDEYVDKLKENEIIDDAITHAKIILDGPQRKKPNRDGTRRKIEIQDGKFEKPSAERHETVTGEEQDYAKFELSDLQEKLIKSLPVVDNPTEYEQNITEKYAVYDSKQRKELLEDCWTVTRLAKEHNVTRQDVQREILTDEFLEKGLIGVFKVNPANIRSLKILYRRPLQS